MAPANRLPGRVCVQAAVGEMERHRVMALPVTDESGRVAGMVHLHDLMRAGAV